MEALTAARVPCAPVLSMEEVIAHPHMSERQAFSSVPHPTRGEVRVTSAPFQVDGAPVGAPGYRAGKDTRAILADTLVFRRRIDALLALAPSRHYLPFAAVAEPLEAARS